MSVSRDHVSSLFFFLMIRRPPRSTLFPYTTPSDLFSNRVADYLRYRPGYPPAVLDLLRLECGLRADHVIAQPALEDRKSTRLNSSHGYISYAVFCLKKKKTNLTSFHLFDSLHPCVC